MMATAEQRRLQKWIRVVGEPDIEMSKIAADKLAEMGASEAIPALINALETRTTFVAVASAQALGKIGDKTAIKPLIQAMQQHNEIAVQTAAAEALGKIGDKKAVPALKREVETFLHEHKNDRYSLTRGFKRGLFTTCIAALKKIGTSDAIRFAKHAESANRRL
ncbi:MAG: HEAT repeat domain-containing protein [Aggregatilineales bacterium]